MFLDDGNQSKEVRDLGDKWDGLVTFSIGGYIDSCTEITFGIKQGEDRVLKSNFPP